MDQLAKEIAIPVFTLIVIVLFKMVTDVVKELLKPSPKVKTVYPDDYNPSIPYSDQVKKHWQDERIMASARVRTFEAYECIDEQIYMIMHWPECSEVEVKAHLRLAADLVNKEV